MQHSARIARKVRAAGFPFLVNEQGKLKFPQKDFEGVEALVIHPSDTTVDAFFMKPASFNSGHCYAYHIADRDNTMHIFFTVYSIVKWLEARREF